MSNVQTSDFSVSPTYQRGVRITNTGDTDYIDKYDNQRYVIKAGADQFVPFDAACHWLGDPRFYDSGPQDKHRTEEFHRVAARLGAVDDPELFEQNRPSLEVYSQDGSTRYIMVADDPEGPGQNVFESDQQDMSDPEVRIRLLEQRLAELEGQANKSGPIDDTLAELGIGDDQADTSKGDVKSGPKGGSSSTSTPGLPPVDEPKIPAAKA